MPLLTTNRVFLVVLLFALGTASGAVPGLLQRIKDAAKTPPSDPPQPAKNLQKDSEDALQIDTLRTLADGYSYDLRNAAIKIVVSRTSRSGARDLLLRDLASRNYLERENAINAIKLILTNSSLSDSVVNEFRDINAIKAVVKGLINVLHDRKHGKSHGDSQRAAQADIETKTRLPSSPIRPTYRPAQELGLMFILSNIFNNHSRRSMQYIPVVDAALKAGLVTQWLANYPFPCTLAENSHFNYKRSDVARLFERMAWQSDDPHMGDIILAIMQYPLGRKQMRQVGLNASSVRENVHTDPTDRQHWTWDTFGDDHTDVDGTEDQDNDVRMTNAEDTAGLLPISRDVNSWEEFDTRPTTRAGARLRSAERSQEEEHLRRRHREAVVLAERGTPLTRDNIFQREDSPNSRAGTEPELDDATMERLLSRPDRHLSDQQINVLQISQPEVRVRWQEGPDEFIEADDGNSHGTSVNGDSIEAEEDDRAQRRHREMEHLIEENLELQRTSSEEGEQQTADTATSSDTMCSPENDPSAQEVPDML